MPPTGEPPIACTRQGAQYRERIAANQRLAGTLISQRRDGRTLTLTYPIAVSADVRRMVAAEQECCAFLQFDVSVSGDRVTLVITVPERADAVADDVFAQFMPDGAAASAGPRRLASGAAMTAAAGAVACGVCCALPFAWPAVVAAGFGGTVAWFGRAQREVTMLASLVVIAALIYVAWHRSEPSS